MSAPSAFLVVGHRNWGYSTTLRALTKKRGWVRLNGHDFVIRRMSNDDKPDRYEDFVSGLDPREKPYVLVAYCPEDGAPKLLESLGRKYRLHLLILEHSYTDSRTVSGNEIALLRRYGTVQVFNAPGRSSSERAAALGAFISRHT